MKAPQLFAQKMKAKLGYQIQVPLSHENLLSVNLTVMYTMPIKNTEFIAVDRLMRSGVLNADYISQKKEEATLGIKEEEVLASQDIDEEEEDAYRWEAGILQEYYDREVFKGTVSLAELSFVGTIGFSFCGLLGPITPYLMKLMGARLLLLCGTLLGSAGLVLASYSTKVWQLYMTQSVMHGMGTALLFIVSMSISPQWFNKKRAFAVGIMVSGSGIGGLLMPFVITFLNESLGITWCYRILSIISFVLSLIPTLLLRERKQDFETKQRPIIDLKICKNSSFIIWCIVGNLSYMSYYIPAFYIPSHATKIGLKPSQGSLLVSVFSGVNVFGRIFSGFLGDRIGVINANTILLLTCGLSSFLVWSFSDSFYMLLVFIIFYGFASGTVPALLAPITASITGLENYSSGICLYLFFLTPGRLGPSIAGAIQSATDKHSFLSHQMFTGSTFVASFLVSLYLKYYTEPSIWKKV
ncbi:major facilitator superfamily domain-containing protein [Choanephora cucurbitarum]|nr:major facilitator superfamily domain-containing protein [Choanephora cucurbitarum]